MGKNKHAIATKQIDKNDICWYTYFIKGAKGVRSSEKQELKRKIQRVGWFMLIVFIPALVIAVVLGVVARVPQWLNILVLVIILFVLFFIYAYLMSKLDERKKKRMDKKKDPFSD